MQKIRKYHFKAGSFSTSEILAAIRDFSRAHGVVPNQAFLNSQMSTGLEGAGKPDSPCRQMHSEHGKLYIKGISIEFHISNEFENGELVLVFDDGNGLRNPPPS